MTGVKLRDYQDETVGAVYADWFSYQRVAAVLPTGAGKTVVFSSVADRWINENRLTTRQRVLILVHREELAEQARKTLAMMCPHLRVSIVQAERGDYPATADVIIGMVQTLRNERRRNLISHVGLIIVDECHHVAASSYQMILEHYGCFADGGAKALGVTATMMRGDNLSLGDTWQKISYTKDIAWMVSRGYLVPPDGRLVRVSDLDLSRVRKKAGDFSDSALGDALEQSLAPDAVARAYKEHSADRQGILFAPTVHCAEVYAEALGEFGFETAVVHGKTPTGQRRAIFRAYERGDIQVISNCGIATEGTDLPMTGTVVIGRPTQSRGLFIQMAGRGLRLWPGKTDCLILVVAGKAARHSLTAPVELFGEQLEMLPEEVKEADEKAEADEQFMEMDVPGSGPELPEFANGKHLEVVKLDLFRRAGAYHWQQTAAGTWFLPAGERFILIKPQADGTWAVLWCHREYGGPGMSGWIETAAPDMGWAMGIAQEAMTHAERNAGKAARKWREKAPDRHRVGIAISLGVPEVTARMTKRGELERLIDIHQATRRLDPFIR